MNINTVSSNLTRIPAFTAVPSQPVMIPDLAQLAASPQVYAQPQEKQNAGVVQSFKNIVAGVKKFFTAASEYTVGTVKGLVLGGIAAGVTYAGIWTANIIRAGSQDTSSVDKAVTDETAKEVLNTLNKIKNARPGMAGTAIALGIGSLPVIYSLYGASLNVSEKTAGIDHKYNTGHRFEA